MIDFKRYFEEMIINNERGQKKVKTDNEIGVYYGITTDGKLRLSFLTKSNPFKIESTKNISVIQGKESDICYWTCFDLVNNLPKDVFYTFCSDLLAAIKGKCNELQELQEIANRYYSWKSLFKNKGRMSPEKIQGLYGELLFLNNFMVPKYGADSSVLAWGGPNGFNKDFSIGDDWYEVKTVNSTSTSVVIHSIAQLSSKQPGKLVIISIEKMTSEYTGQFSSVESLIANILDAIEQNVNKDEFLKKLAAYGFEYEENDNNERFKFDEMNFYMVDDKFPRLKEEDIIYPEITKLVYELNIHALEKYKENS